jgi:hypothetical protein
MERQMSTGAVVTHPIPGLEQKPIFQKQYRVKGSDVSWYSVWQPDNSLAIVFYDQGRDEGGSRPEIGWYFRINIQSIDQDENQTV